MSFGKSGISTLGLRIIISLGVALLLSACETADPAQTTTKTKPKSHGTPSTGTPAVPPISSENSLPTSSPATNSGATTDVALSSFTDIAVRAGLQIQDLQVVQGLTSVSKYFCSSPNPLGTDSGNGDMTFTIDDMDPPGQSTGDSFSVTFNQCAYSGQAYDGASEFKVDEISGTPYSPSPTAWRVATSHNASLTMTSATTSQTLKTAFGFSSGTPDGVLFERNISGLLDLTAATVSMKNTFDNQRNWNINTNTFVQSVNNASSGGFGEFTLLTLQAMSGPLGQAPDAGQVRTTLNIPGAIIMITTYTVVGSGNVKVELDIGGDGTLDSVFEQPWNASAAAGYFG